MVGNKDLINGKEKDILQNPSLRENPFAVPDGYFAAVEDSVHKKIYSNGENTNPLIAFLKTSVALASVFGIIFGLGYGAMYLTDTLDTQSTASGYTIADSDFSFDDFIITAIGSYPIMESSEEIDNSPNISDTLIIDTEQIEQYLIDSNVSITALASLE